MPRGAPGLGALREGPDPHWRDRAGGTWGAFPPSLAGWASVRLGPHPLDVDSTKFQKDFSFLVLLSCQSSSTVLYPLLPFPSIVYFLSSFSYGLCYFFLSIYSHQHTTHWACLVLSYFSLAPCEKL